MHPPTVNVIFILWNREFNYYKEQPLDSTMVKHKLKGGMSFGTNCMKSKTKDTIVEIQPTLLNQIHFPTCVHITIWAAINEKHVWMIGVKLDEFCRLNWNTINLPWLRKSFATFGFPMKKNLYMTSILHWIMPSVKFSNYQWKVSLY